MFTIFLALPSSHKGIWALPYSSSGLFIFHWYFLLVLWDMAQNAQKRISGFLKVLLYPKILWVCDCYGSVNDHWNKVELQEKTTQNNITDKKSSFMLYWLFSKPLETVANHLKEKGKERKENCTVQFSVKSIVQFFSGFSW